MFTSILHPLVQWIERALSSQKIEGSIPLVVEILLISHRNLRHIIASKAPRKPIQISTLGKFDPWKTIKRTKAPKRGNTDWVSPTGLWETFRGDPVGISPLGRFKLILAKISCFWGHGTAIGTVWLYGCMESLVFRVYCPRQLGAHMFACCAGPAKGDGGGGGGGGAVGGRR